MVVDWPAMVGYRVEQSHLAATILFDAPAEFRGPQIAAGLGTAVTAASAASDGRTSRIALQLSEGTELRHLRVGTRIVVDLLHHRSSASPSLPAGATRPWEKEPPRGSQAPVMPTWVDGSKALAAAADTGPDRRRIAASAPKPAVSRPEAAPVPAVSAPSTQTRPARPEPAPTAAATAAPATIPAEAQRQAASAPASPWRQAVRQAACRGDLERAAAVLGERMSESPLDPVDWYNLTWLLRTLAGLTMEPPPKPPESPVYDAPLIGLCSGRPIAGTVSSWQRLAHAGQFTEFLVDLAPTAASASANP
jgi:hypothetical protein